MNGLPRFVFPWSARVLVGALLVALSVSGSASAESKREEEEDDRDNFREDVLACEEAVVRLQSCCPGFRASRISCRYRHYRKASANGCDSSTASASRFEHVQPALNERESECIQATDCAKLRDTGVCTRAQEAVEYIERRSTYPASSDAGADWPSDLSQSHPPVCP